MAAGAGSPARVTGADPTYTGCGDTAGDVPGTAVHGCGPRRGCAARWGAEGAHSPIGSNSSRLWGPEGTRSILVLLPPARSGSAVPQRLGLSLPQGVSAAWCTGTPWLALLWNLVVIILLGWFVVLFF